MTGGLGNNLDTGYSSQNFEGYLNKATENSEEFPAVQGEVLEEQEAAFKTENHHRIEELNVAVGDRALQTLSSGSKPPISPKFEHIAKQHVLPQEDQQRIATPALASLQSIPPFPSLENHQGNPATDGTLYDPSKLDELALSLSETPPNDEANLVSKLAKEYTLDDLDKLKELHPNLSENAFIDLELLLLDKESSITENTIEAQINDIADVQERIAQQTEELANSNKAIAEQESNVNQDTDLVQKTVEQVKAKEDKFQLAEAKANQTQASKSHLGEALNQAKMNIRNYRLGTENGSSTLITKSNQTHFTEKHIKQMTIMEENGTLLVHPEGKHKHKIGDKIEYLKEDGSMIMIEIKAIKHMDAEQIRAFTEAIQHFATLALTELLSMSNPQQRNPSSAHKEEGEAHAGAHSASHSATHKDFQGEMLREKLKEALAKQKAELTSELRQELNQIINSGKEELFFTQEFRRIEKRLAKLEQSIRKTDDIVREETLKEEIHKEEIQAEVKKSDNLKREMLQPGTAMKEITTAIRETIPKIQEEIVSLPKEGRPVALRELVEVKKEILALVTTMVNVAGLRSSSGDIGETASKS